MRISIKIVSCFLLITTGFSTNKLAAQKAVNDSVKAITTQAKKAQIMVEGIVKDASNGKPLSAISVTVEGYSAALTDDKGKFKIKVPNKGASLSFDGEGFQTKEIALKGRNNVTAELYEESFTTLYDQVKLPSGDKKATQTGFAVNSVNNINGNWGRTNETTDGYLQGRAAGLNATMRSGTPNAGAYMNIRGLNSMYTNNQPLIIVDGAIYDISDYGSSVIANHYTNALAMIDPKDIENITIIKDGTSTYGTKGANGVINITTIHAKQQATKIDFGAFAGVNIAPTNLPVMQSADYRVYVSDLLKTKGLTDAQIQAQPFMIDNTSNPDYYRYHNETNWQNQVMSNNPTSNFYLKISGGDNIAKYALSMGYGNNSGITDNTQLTRYNVRFNGDLNISNRLTAQTNFSFTYYDHFIKDQGIAPKTNPIFLAQTKSPFLNTNEVDNVGNISPNRADSDIFGVSNPVAAIETMFNSSKAYRFFGTIAFNYKLSKTLNLGTVLGITFDKVREQRFVPRKGIANDTLANAIADSRLAGNVKRISSLYNETFLAYNKTFNTSHNLQVKAGFRYLNSTNEQDISIGYNSATDDFISVGTGINTLRKVGGDIGKYGWMNYFASADYSYNNKYFISYNMSVDGSSRFGKEAEEGMKIGDFRYAFMPSIAAGWLISSERFLANSKWIDLLKLRVSLGKTGNDDIGNYTSKQSYISQNLLGVQGLVRGNVSNPQLQWETGSRFNIGTDINLLNERLSFSFDYFSNTTTKMLSYENLPAASGFLYAVSNSGAMKNSGFDFSVNYRVVNKQQLKFDMGLILMKYKGTLTQLPQDIITNYGGATLLSKAGADGPAVFYGYKTNGVYATDQEAATAGLTKLQPNGTYATFQGGDVKFIDVNGDKIIDDKDRQNIGNPNPDFTGAVTSKLSWKAFTLDLLFTFSSGNKIYNGVRAKLESQSSMDNQLLSVNNRWRAQGQVTNMPKTAWGDPMGNSSFSDRWIEDGSFFRMKSVTLNYLLPLKPTNIVKNISFYVTGNNLLTFSKYLGYDPEFYGAENVFARGVDMGLEPIGKSIIAGIRIGL
jgi:TonB-linked SusC/RagA family outer membrane protein